MLCVTGVMPKVWLINPRPEGYGSRLVIHYVRGGARRHTVVVLSVILSVFYKYFSSLTEN